MKGLPCYSGGGWLPSTCWCEWAQGSSATGGLLCALIDSCLLTLTLIGQIKSPSCHETWHLRTVPGITPPVSHVWVMLAPPLKWILEMKRLQQQHMFLKQPDETPQPVCLMLGPKP